MRKPPGLTPIQIHPERPDCCADCPLLGIIPKGHPSLPKYSKKSHVCLGTRRAMTEAETYKRSSTWTDTKHPIHRPCDEFWEMWLGHPEQKVLIPDGWYRECRIPYERTQPLNIIF